MWWSAYLQEINRQFRDVYGFQPPCDVPDGEYPMTIEGKIDRVKIIKGKIHCYNFDEPEPAEPGEA